jgi:hypothetical protein
MNYSQVLGLPRTSGLSLAANAEASVGSTFSLDPKTLLSLGFFNEGVDPDIINYYLKMSIVSNPFVGGLLSISVPLPPAISGHLILTDEEQQQRDLHQSTNAEESPHYPTSPVPHAIFSELLMKHSQMNELRGILIAFAKARFVGQDDKHDDSDRTSTTLATLHRGGGGGRRHLPVGRIIGAIPLIHTRVCAEVLVFRPVAGQILKGVVTHAAASHIAILVLGLFTASVLQSDMAGGYVFGESEGSLSKSSSQGIVSAVGGKRSREDEGGKNGLSKGGKDDGITLAPASKKSRKERSDNDVVAAEPEHDVERLGGGVWVKISGQNEDAETSLTQTKEDVSSSHKASISSSSSPFNRIFANNPDRIQKGSEVVFVVTSVLHSAGVLTIQGSFVDPLYKGDQGKKIKKKKKDKKVNE